ncbi:MAG TPA: nucleoside-diphosphate sugar epimerase/dehydratase [Gammaproteobacteria bacterium]|nr:polysaccharide biosynthesis protein [Xanthomonadales bacterium]MCB1593746.1 polysaccharide biosynthesis protein [Xanthomonadales bacterium]HOP22019.1 nucleoside-diphosphate sugar epimerase/dehydratase [Gammaproteobacteria bacterium]HPI95173.1 nucleoside-diphosphate sugar epimerase/dehydratase [Gammaproteobacteria bacterium]HPQ86710.1 nucleoside-diphosphate sugar epimerase/dehydratase [Gammaproteobacteria bacterium]
MNIFHPRFAVVLHDLFMTWSAWMLSYVIRYSVWVDSPELSWFNYEFATVILVQGVIAYYFNLYRGLWRFASVPDLINIAKSAVVGTFIIAFIMFLVHRADGVPRSVLLMYPFILMVLWGVPRLTYRMFKDLTLHINNSEKQRVLLVGAGRLADMFIRHAHASALYEVVGIVDDERNYKGSNLRGVKVLGGVADIEKICKKREVRAIVVTKENISASMMKEVVDNSMTSNCQLLTLPNLDKITEKGFEISHLTPVTIDDILGREKVSIDWSNVAKAVQGKSVLITGGGGSIGSELARQLAQLDLKKLCILDHSEFNLYQIDRELSNKNNDLIITSLLVNVTDKAHLQQIFSTIKPDIVFHAAAYKHVPLLEKMPCEGFINNVIGTKNIVDTCHEFNVEKMVLVSTDKAVNPYNIMGATKRIAEMYCQSRNKKSNTDYVIVRFGNVLGSAGSVVPLFKEQIAKGGPVTVTHEEMTRYFMTITEACQLIVQSMVLGSNGDIHVLDMGKPVSILSLANRMISLSGKIPEVDIKVEITGLRPGEKMHEQLYYDVEQLKHTSHNKIYHLQSTIKHSESYEKLLNQAITQAIQFQDVDLTQTIKKLVPEFVHQPHLKIVENNN